jgi:hypothetical protein
LCSPNFYDYSYEEKNILRSHFDSMGRNQPVYDNYKSDLEVDMQDFQEHTVDPYPLFIKENNCEEIIHLEQHDEEKNFPMGHVYDDYESKPWESQEEELEEQQKGQFISCLEPVSEQPLPNINKISSSSHPPMHTSYIHPCLSIFGVEKAFCYRFHRIFHSFYEPINNYMEWHFLHILETPYFISTSSFEEKLKGVTILLSRLHHLLVITDRVKELPFKKLLDWLW